MKAYEFPVRVTEEKKLEFSDDLLNALPANEVVRLILLVDDPEERATRLLQQREDDEVWERLTVDQFLDGYSEADSIYDKV